MWEDTAVNSRLETQEDTNHQLAISAEKSGTCGVTPSFPFVSHVILHEFISEPIYYWLSTICLHAFNVFSTEKLVIQFR